MAGILISAGANMPLHLQLSGYDVGLWAHAILKDDSGTFLKTVDLVDRGDGLYTALEPMPSKNVIATYQTFKDAGKTQFSNDGAGLDIFILDTFQPVRRDDKIVGVIDQSISIDAEIVQNPVLNGVMDSFDIQGQINVESSIGGEISDSQILGVIQK